MKTQDTSKSILGALNALHCALLLVSVLTGSSTSALGNVLYVDTHATGAKDGSTWSDAFTNLQVALAEASAGDEIWVAAGTYTPTGPIEAPGRGKPFPVESRLVSFQLRSEVGLYGGFAGAEADANLRDPIANRTVLSGDLNGNDDVIVSPLEFDRDGTRRDNSYHVVDGTGADETAVLDGFVITGGYADGRGADANGGGMVNGPMDPGHATLINCTFEGNFAAFSGGGVYNSGGYLSLVECTFNRNHSDAQGWDAENAWGVGGRGLYNHDAGPFVEHCTFRMNSTRGQGAGLHNYASTDTVVVHCDFDRNRVIGSGGRNTGGGFFGRQESVIAQPLILNCAFTGNIARNGGGIGILHDSDLIVVNTTFSGNVSTGGWRGAANGGGMFVAVASPTLINCTFAGNIATADSSGAGLSLYVSGVTTVTNCIFWGNRANGITDETAQIHQEEFSHPVLVNTSCVENGWSDGGIGNINLAPLFMDADGPDDMVGTADDDLRLAIDSPCIDLADAMAIPVDMIDLDGDGDTTEAIPHDRDGNPRVLGDGIDMGAYEWEFVEAYAKPQAQQAGSQGPGYRLTWWPDSAGGGALVWNSGW